MRASLRRIWLAGAVLLASVSLAGCSVLLSGPTPERTERPVVVVPEAPAELVPEGTAEENEAIFLQVLQEASLHEGAFTSQGLAQYFLDAGFERESLQVSQDRTRTDLEPESMFISARFDDMCLVGQIVTADRSFVAEVLPAVGPDKNLCLIGQTQSIDP